MSDLSDRTTVVVGTSWGLGRGIAASYVAAGGLVVAVSHTATGFPERANGAGNIQSEVADAGDATAAEDFLARAGPLVTPEIAGTTLVELVRADAAVAPGYLLTGASLQKLP